MLPLLTGTEQLITLGVRATTGVARACGVRVPLVAPTADLPEPV
jgi:hypothetical protein